MIHVRDVSKRYDTRAGPVTVLDHINLTIAPGERVGILGRNGAGKSTFVRLISGAERPTSGVIERNMSTSWPLAFGGAFQGALTGLDNLRFICRIYGRPVEGTIDFVQEFSELGVYLREPVRTYSSGMRARLAFAISMVVEFDCFLIDEIIAVGDARFQAKCHVELFEKRADRAMIVVSHDANFIRTHCHRAAVLNQGRLISFDTIDEAYSFYGDALFGPTSHDA
jgi:capsular polysaccharide transport system ATP-binding protein